MKHITILLAFLIAGITNIYSQDVSGLDYNDLASKLEKSNKALENPKKSSDPKFWVERAKLFMDIADVNTQFLAMGRSQKEITLFCKEPKEKKQTAEGEEYIYERFVAIFKDGKLDAWKETKNIVPNPIDDAMSCINKAIELDTEKKADKKIAEALKSMKGLYMKNALNYYNLKDSVNTYKYFKQLVALNDMKQVNTVDTAIIFNAGLTAVNAGAYDDAIKYFKRAIDLKYTSEPSLYANLKRAYLAKGDTVNAIASLRQGIKSFPNDLNIIIELINYYITINDKEAALEYIGKAKQNDPKNRSFFYVEGYLYDKMSGVIESKMTELDNLEKAEISQLNENKKAEFKKTNNNIQKYKPIDDKYKKLISDAEAKYKQKGDSLLAISSSLQSKALEQYKQAIEIDPTYFEAYYNIAVMYYNNGLRLADQAGKEVDDAKYQAKKNASDEEFKKAAPNMELAYEVNQKSKASPAEIKKNRDIVLDVLKSIYYRLRLDDQFARIKKLQEEAQ